MIILNSNGRRDAIGRKLDRSWRNSISVVSRAWKDWGAMPDAIVF